MAAFRHARSEMVEDFGNEEWWERGSNPTMDEIQDVNWKQKLWWSVIQYQGFASMEITRPWGGENWKARLLEIRTNIEGLKKQPKTRMFSENPRGAEAVSECPNLHQEVFLCIQNGETS